MNTLLRIVQYVGTGLIIVLLVYFALRIKRQFQIAVAKDEAEKTTKHIKRLLAEWGITLAVGVVAGIVVYHFRGEGILNVAREFLYGKTVPVTMPWDNH
jgi:hypothetical protein